MSVGSHNQWSVLIERLKSRWSQCNIRHRLGVSREEIQLFEARYQVCMPLDMREFFTTVDGMGENEMDDDCFSFHRLCDVKSVPEELANFGGIPDYRKIMDTLPQPALWFVFADFLIYSAAFAIRLSAGGDGAPVVWIGDGTRHHIVANSFSSFLHIYLTAPDELGAGAIELS